MKATATRATFHGMRVLTLTIALLAATPAIAGPAQFDLACSGKTNDGAPWSTRIAVDLDHAAYCEQPCEVQRQIAAIEPGFVKFEIAPGAMGFHVSRVDGHVQKSLADGWADGECQLAPFTPFPKTLF